MSAGRQRVRGLGVLLVSACLGLGALASVRPLNAQESSAAEAAAPRRKKKSTGKKLAEALDKLLAVPDSARRPGAGGGDAAGPTGRLIRNLVIAAEAPDTLSARFQRDTSTVMQAPATPCGPRRVCAAGWDLRVQSVEVPGPEVPFAQPLWIRTVLENRGRAAAPATELMLCVFDGSWCPERLLLVEVPPIGAGETVTLVRAAPLDAREHIGQILATIDPDQASPGERDRTNNTGRSGSFRTVLPEIQLLSVEVPTEVRAGPALPVTVRLRNKSNAATSPAVEVQLAVENGCGVFGGNSEGRFTLPAVGPRQTVTVRLQLLEGAKTCYLPASTFRFTVDPDGRYPWGPAHERELTRAFTIR